MACVPFDKQAWKDRAWARCVKAGQTVEAEDRFHASAGAIDGIARLVEWAGQRGLKIEFDPHEDGGALEGNVISINSRLSVEKQLCYLVHECGHHLIGIHEKHQRFGAGYGDETPGVTRTLKHRIAVVEEELEAWHRGRKLAKRLKLRVDEGMLDRIRIASIKTYMSWCLRRGEFVTQ